MRHYTRDNTSTNPGEAGVQIFGLNDIVISGDTDLWNGIIQSPITANEQGTIVPLTRVWTGTTINGFNGGDVSLGGLNADGILAGRSSDTGNSWVTVPDLLGPTTVPRPLYAISGMLTVVPEPSTMVLVCIAATAVVGWQLRGRRMRCG